MSWARVFTLGLERYTLRGHSGGVFPRHSLEVHIFSYLIRSTGSYSRTTCLVNFENYTVAAIYKYRYDPQPTSQPFVCEIMELRRIAHAVSSLSTVLTMDSNIGLDI